LAEKKQSRFCKTALKICKTALKKDETRLCFCKGFLDVLNSDRKKCQKIPSFFHKIDAVYQENGLFRRLILHVSRRLRWFGWLKKSVLSYHSAGFERIRVPVMVKFEFEVKDGTFVPGSLSIDRNFICRIFY
jgi:hypothetical protein